MAKKFCLLFLIASIVIPIIEYKNAMEILDDARKKDPTNQYFEDLTETANDMKQTDFKDLVKYIYD